MLKLFGTRSNEREIKRSDFHIPKGKKPEEIDKNMFYIEAVIDFPELETNNTIIENTVPSFFQRMVVDGAKQDPYMRIRLEASWEKSNSPEGNIDFKISFITAPEGEKIENQDKSVIPVRISDIRSNIQMIYVPAIREPSNQLRNTSGTILWRILNGINWPKDIDDRLKEKIAEVDSLFNKQEGVKKLQDIICSQWKSLHRDARYTEAKVKFSSNDLVSILKKIEVEFSPTEIPQSYNIESLGEGLRSLFYFSLVNSLLEIESFALEEQSKDGTEKLFNILPPPLTILAVEEPENHISPHLLGKVISNLYEIAKRDNAQVLITSHTPSIIKRIEPESICHLRICKDKLCTIHNNILLPDKMDEAYKYVKEAVRAYPEIYFARLVLLGEGDSEEIIISKAIETRGSSIDSCGISVVPLGGRFVNHFWKLLNALEIPYLTLLDLDSERKDGGWGRIKYVFDQLIKIGYKPEDILPNVNGKPLSIEKFNKMHNWGLDNPAGRKVLMTWVEILKKWGIYFSDPLDLDFSMLSSFEENYKATVPDNGGPDIPDKEKENEKYLERLEKAIRSTLKGNGGRGKSYESHEKELMPWYTYLFLYRGKPSTHILALANIDEGNFKENMPQSLKELIGHAKKILNDDPKSVLGDNTKGT